MMRRLVSLKGTGRGEGAAESVVRRAGSELCERRMRTAMDVYHELCRLCRLCCCCPGDERRDDRKDVEYVLHDAADSVAPAQPTGLNTAASTSTLKAKYAESLSALRTIEKLRIFTYYDSQHFTETWA